MRPLLVAASALLLVPAVAYAQPLAQPPSPPPPATWSPPPFPAPPAPARDRVGPAFDLTVGLGAHLGEAGSNASRSTLLVRAGGGVSHGRFAALVSVALGWLGELEESGTLEPGTGVPPSFLEYGAEPSLRYELTRGQGRRIHVRGGWRWRWLRATSELPRTCDRNGGCDGGFYNDTPTYPVHGPMVALGIGSRLRGDMWGAYGVELAVGHGVIRRPGTNPDLDDITVTVGFNLALGRGAQ